MIVPINNTIVDVAFNLSGSLAGIPAILDQLPVGDRVGFDTLPYLDEDVSDVGQTWTPDLAGRNIAAPSVVYNVQAVRKAPFGTPLELLQPAIDYGKVQIMELYLDGIIE
jgi:hypothetical protein